MRKVIVVILFLVSALVVNYHRGFAQIMQATSTGWTSNNPFRTDVFVENHGQFDKWAPSKTPILYAVNNSDKIFFSKHSVIFKLEKKDTLSEEEREQRGTEEEDADAAEQKTAYVTMNWEGCNADVELIVSEKAVGYYTFGEKGYENIKAIGYKKLLYKNIYPNIDIEYTIPEKGGIKYRIILHPNANPAVLKMHYSGAIEKLLKDKEGNIVVQTQAGDIIDYAPESFLESTQSKINSSFSLHNKTVTFQIQALDSKNHTIIIDPWTVIPNGLDTTKVALDIEYDNQGNVYVSGGTGPYKLSKYSSAGVFQWTFTNPSTWSNNIFTYWYSKFCIMRNSGTTFIAEGYSGASGNQIMKIGSNGLLTLTSTYFGANNEIWTMFYNTCSNQILAFGGGTNSNHNIKNIADTNLSSCVSWSFNGLSCYCNDITSVVMDANGDFFALLTSVVNCAQIDGHLQKSLFPTNYNPPCAFDVPTFYNFQEGQLALHGVNGNIITVRSNSLAVNHAYVYTFDGKTLKAWNKTNGLKLDTIIVDNTYNAGILRDNEGIDVDEANTVYVGGINKVHVFSFNGSTFTTLSPITTNIPNKVHDIRLDRAKKVLYVCGYKFVSVLNAPVPCTYTFLSTSIITDTCKGNACITASGGIPPYTYLWSNGATDSCVFGMPTGIYTIKVSDNSCIKNIHIDTIPLTKFGHTTITPTNPVICAGDSIALVATNSSPGISYHWSNGHIGNVNKVAPSSTKTFTVITTNGVCSDTNSATVKVNPIKLTSLNPIICNGESYPVGNNLYTTSGIYKDTLATYLTCDSIITTNLKVIPPPELNFIKDTVICKGKTMLLDASNQYSTYLWQDSSKNPTYTIRQEGIYWVKVSVDSNCVVIDSIKIQYQDCFIPIYIPNSFTPNGDGLNDEFKIETMAEFSEFKMYIYDRWGELLFESDDKTYAWDGTYKGKKVNNDIYVYIIKGTTKYYNEQIRRTGRVTVVR